MMTIHSTVLTQQEKAACLSAYVEGQGKFAALHDLTIRSRVSRIDQLEQAWRQTRDVRALLAWSEAVGEQARKLTAQVRAERLKMEAEALR